MNKYKFIKALDKSEYLPSHFRNTAKEELLLDYVEGFRRQFVQLFPARNPLFLCPFNEFGVRKFVCTTLRPCPQGAAETWDYQTCAKFVADYLDYHPFPQLTELPDLMPSVSLIQKLRKGDALDFSSFLFSLLRGSDYEAYVVSGYATKSICERDLGKLPCPSEFLEASKWEDPNLTFEKKTNEADEEYAKVYNIQSAKADTKSYEAFLENQKEMEIEKQKLLEIERLKKEEAAKLDPLEGRRVHFWILLKAGKRNLEKDLFIEPTTGHCFDTTDPELPFNHIESVFNEQNYWVNVQDEWEQGSFEVGSRTKIQDLSFEFSDTEKWEYVMIAPPMIDENEEPKTEKQEEADKVVEEILTLPPTWVNVLNLTPMEMFLRFPTGTKAMDFAKCSVQRWKDLHDHQEGRVLKLSLFGDVDRMNEIESREIFKHRLDQLILRVTQPLESRTCEQYGLGRPSGLRSLVKEGKTKRTTWFFPNSRPDGMTKRVEVFGQTVEEHFENRPDRVIYRFLEVSRDPKVKTKLATKLTLAGEEDLEFTVCKIIEEYQRNPEIHADEDIRKITVDVLEETFRVQYAYGKHRIACASRILKKNGEIEGWQADQLSKEPNAQSLKHQLNFLVAKEKQLIITCREREREFSKTLYRLQKDQQSVKVEKDPYMIAVEAGVAEPVASEEEDVKHGQRRKLKKKFDPLKSFLGPQGKVANREQAEKARDNCLHHMKERLIKRIEIISRRLHKEVEILEQKRNQFERSQASNLEKSSQEKELERTQETSEFRTRIIRARLARHEKLAKDAMIELNGLLGNDERLKFES